MSNIEMIAPLHIKAEAARCGIIWDYALSKGWVHKYETQRLKGALLSPDNKFSLRYYHEIVDSKLVHCYVMSLIPRDTVGARVYCMDSLKIVDYAYLHPDIPANTQKEIFDFYVDLFDRHLIGIINE